MTRFLAKDTGWLIVVEEGVAADVVRGPQSWTGSLRDVVERIAQEYGAVASFDVESRTITITAAP
jgi:hypothetical protein